LKERRPVGDLYHGVDERTGGPVTLLLASPHVVPPGVYRDQALRELSKLQQIANPAMVKILDSGVIEDGRLYVALEPVVQPTLAAVVGSKGALSLERAIKLMEQILPVLTEYQKMGVAHRELAPSNILLSDDDRIKVLNLGVTSSLGENVYGDPWFMAPEQADGRPVDVRCNIYSLGALFYYAITGTAPYLDAEPKVLLDRHRNDPIQPPSERRSDLDLKPEVDAFMQKAMSKSAAARPLTYEQFGRELKALLGEGAAAAISGASAAATASPSTPKSAPGEQRVSPAVSAPKPEGAAAAATAAAPSAPSVADRAPALQGASPAVSAPEPEADSAPAAAASPSEGGESAAPSKPSPSRRRRRRKGDFRVTMWFKKGDAMHTGEETETEEEDDDLAKVTAGDGSISDHEKNIDERYKDDGSITKEDQAQFSLRTGQTGMMAAVQMPEEGMPGKKMGESEVVESLDKSRRVWLWIFIVVVLLGAGAFGAYIWWSGIPKTFVRSNTLFLLEKKVPDFEMPPKVPAVAPPTFPKGTAKELWAKLLKGAQEKAKVLPPQGYGQGHVLVAFEQKLVELKKKAAEGKKKKRRRRRRKALSPFARIVGRRKAEKAEAKYKELRKNIISELKGMVGTLKGKVYTGGKIDKWARGLQAGRILLALPETFDGKDKIAKQVKRILTNFKKGKPKDTAQPARAAAGKDAGQTAIYEKFVEACREKKADALYALFGETLRKQIAERAKEVRELKLSAKEMAKTWSYKGKRKDFDAKAFINGLIHSKRKAENFCHGADKWKVMTRSLVKGLYVIVIKRPDDMAMAIKLKKKGDQWVLFNFTKPQPLKK
jgi:hypothetical protein